MNAKQAIIGVVVGIVLIAGVAAYVFSPTLTGRRKAPVRSAAPATAPAVAATTTATNQPAGTNQSAALPVDRPSLESRWLTWLRAPLRDPFLLLPPPPPKVETPITPASQLQVSGLWVQTGSRLAVINRGVYGEGDTVLGFKILRIDSDQVQVQGPERTELINFTTYVAGATNAPRGTNFIKMFLGPEKENLRY